ncbi:Hypothetical protein FKW44_016279 [Caligus rogercresseyi]|uniref:Uncharacterized protein n=1 Tax=Caligus rogercresseyi TaxID=217165 RepID=A0A7T8H2H4_CALRO|nr:Hypothetical protein FKW44_016279 [Caligus rogercresseyi]
MQKQRACSRQIAGAALAGRNLTNANRNSLSLFPDRQSRLEPERRQHVQVSGTSTMGAFTTLDVLDDDCC